jgi:hypothetical protein
MIIALVQMLELVFLNNLLNEIIIQLLCQWIWKLKHYSIIDIVYLIFKNEAETDWYTVLSLIWTSTFFIHNINCYYSPDYDFHYDIIRYSHYK